MLLKAQKIALHQNANFHINYECMGVLTVICLHLFSSKKKKKVIFRLCSIFSVPSADFQPFSEMQVCMKGLNYEYEGKYTLLMSLFHFDLVFFKVYGLNKLKTFTLCYIGWSTSCNGMFSWASAEREHIGHIILMADGV